MGSKIMGMAKNKLVNLLAKLIPETKDIIKSHRYCSTLTNLTKSINQITVNNEESGSVDIATDHDKTPEEKTARNDTKMTNFDLLTFFTNLRNKNNALPEIIS
jgi:hypothetical protein